MPQQTAMTATLMCTMGIGPSQLTVLPPNRVFATGQLAANIMDHNTIVNIMPFPMCNSIANPIVAAATAAKLGVFTPAACLPATMTPWTPGATTVMIGGMPALDSTSSCLCMYGGNISIVNPVAMTVMIP